MKLVDATLHTMLHTKKQNISIELQYADTFIGKNLKLMKAMITFDLQLKNPDHNSFCITLSSTATHIRKRQK